MTVVTTRRKKKEAVMPQREDKWSPKLYALYEKAWEIANTENTNDMLQIRSGGTQMRISEGVDGCMEAKGPKSRKILNR